MRYVKSKVVQEKNDTMRLDEKLVVRVSPVGVSQFRYIRSILVILISRYLANP